MVGKRKLYTIGDTTSYAAIPAPHFQDLAVCTSTTPTRAWEYTGTAWVERIDGADFFLWAYGSTNKISANPVTTTTNVFTTVLSIPLVPNQIVSLLVPYHIHTTDYLQAGAGQLQAVYSRGAGNIIQQGNEKDVFVEGFAGALPVVQTVANVTTQSIDIQIRGKAGVSLVWDISAVLRTDK